MLSRDLWGHFYCREITKDLWGRFVPGVVLFPESTKDLWGCVARGRVATLGRLGVVIAGYLGSVPLMLVCTAVAAIGMSPLQGDSVALGIHHRCRQLDVTRNPIKRVDKSTFKSRS